MCLLGHVLPWDANDDGYFTKEEIVAFKAFYGQDVSVNVLFKLTFHEHSQAQTNLALYG